MAGNRICLFSAVGKHSWIIDSGASDHITPNLSLFLDKRPILQQCHIIMPNGSPTQIKRIGFVQIGPNLVLKDILHVPDFQFNLLSISKLTKKTGFHVLFSQDHCLLQDHMSQKVVVLGKEDKGLYCMDANFKQHLRDKPILQQSMSTMLSPPFSFIACLTSTELWHFRLGHPSFELLQFLNLPDCNKQHKSSMCQVCPKAKMHRLPFPLSNNRAGSLFELLHVDI